jgi:hypothetical protein
VEVGNQPGFVVGDEAVFGAPPPPPTEPE